MDSTIRGYGATQQTQAAIAASAVIILTVFLLSWIKQRRVSQRLRLPPGPQGWPVLGSLPSLVIRPHETLRNLATKYGPIMFIHLGSVPTLIVSNADMARAILKTNDQYTASRPTLTVASYLSYNQQGVAWAPYGPVWREGRKVCTLQLLTASRLSQFQDTREGEIRFILQGMVEESSNGTILNMYEVFGDMTMNIITQMMWRKRHRGIKEDSQSADNSIDDLKFVRLIRDLFDLMGDFTIVDFLPGPAAFKSSLMTIQGLNKRMKVIHEKLDLFIDRIIKGHQDNELLSGDQTVSDADDFVDVLLKLQKSGEALSPQMMKATLTDLLTVGTDTSAVTLEWALAELIKHPTMLTRTQEELNLVVGPDRLVSGDDIPNLPYLQAVIRETFRLHPPGPLGVPHKSVQDCEIANYHIPAKTMVFVNIRAIHTDPAVYERPEEFNPDRFLHSAKDFKGTDLDLIPFGSGRRMCPAVNLASATVHLGLAQMIHAFTWTLPKNQKPEELDMSEAIKLMVVKADSLKVLAKPRLRHDVYYPA